MGITEKLTTHFGLDELSARLTEIESAISVLKDFQRAQHVRLTQLEVALTNLASRHDLAHERIARVERQNLPVRYVQTDKGLQEVR